VTQDKQNPPVFQLFTVSEAADALHLHLSRLRRLIRARTWTGSGMAMIGPSQLLLNNSTPRSRGGMNLYRCRSLKDAVESFMS